MLTVLPILYVLGMAYAITSWDPKICVDKTVCIQVFTYNEEDSIARTLKSILEQSYVKRCSNVRLQVFDSSTDKTPYIARYYGFEVYTLPRGKLFARNYSVTRFPTCYIHVHVDGDTYLPPNWLSQAIYMMTRHGAVAVSSPRVYEGLPIITHVIALWRVWLRLGLRLFGSACAIRHDVFAKNLFNTRYDGREDMIVEEEYLFTVRVSRHGRIIYIPVPHITRMPTRKYVY